jgi:subtilisin family serine protease
MLLAVALPPLSHANAADTAAPHALAVAPSYKFKNAKYPPPSDAYVAGEVLVRFRDEATASVASEDADASLQLATPGGERIEIAVETFGGSELVEGLRLARVAPDETLQAIDALNARPDVLYAEPNYIRRKDALPNDPSFGEQWALRNTGQVGFNDYTGQQAAGNPGSDIDAELAWNTTTGSRSVVVGVIDEGIDINHQDLQANIWRNTAEIAGNRRDDDANGYIDDINGWDFYHNDGSVYDGAAGENTTDAHGTHVAGTIGAVGNNGTGVSGVNWQVSLMSLKILPKECPDSNPNCDPGGSAADAINAYRYAKMMRDLWLQTGGARGANIRVLNNSYGSEFASQSEFDTIATLQSSGILFVTAAGNNTTDNAISPHFPSDYDLPHTISVAATDRFDQIAIFSNFASEVVKMGAPGRGIYSTTPHNTYEFFSGTSMASPHVAGAAALILAQYPDISVQRLRNSLVYNGDPLTSLSGKVYSQRRLNVNRSLQAIGANDNTLPGNISDLRIVSQQGRAMTLAWTAPGDDGNGGTAAALYEITISNPNFPLGRILLATKIPSAPGSQETATVNIPYQTVQGTVSVRTFDRVGANSSNGVYLSQVNDTSAVNPYTVTQSGASALTSGGTPLQLVGDDRYRENYPLPFAFPFFGQTRSTVNISTNGALYFTTPPKRSQQPAPGEIAADAGSSIELLNLLPMIAGMWDDLRTDRSAGGDVYVVQPDANRIIFRWQGVTYDTEGTGRGERPINFEIELRSDGTIQMRYGNGQSAPTNTNLLPVVGISAGQPEAYTVASHTSESAFKSLTNAPTLTFTPRPPAPNFNFQFSTANYAAPEHNSAVSITVTRPANTPGGMPILGRYTVNYSTRDGSANAGSDFIATSGVLTFDVGEASKSFIVPLINDNTVEPDETFNIILSSPSPNSGLGTPSTTTVTIVNDDVNAGPNTVQFGASNLTVDESIGRIEFTVSRTGDTSQPARVAYQTANLTASERSDYNTARGWLRFGANETTKTFEVFINNDVYTEPTEALLVELRTTIGTSLGGTSAVTVQITDNDAGGAPNPIDDSTFFVRQHYVDFFNREPDASGLAFWTNQIEGCGANVGCREVRRINVSAAFFVSTEFQQTGYFVYRMHQAAYNTGERLHIHTFLLDTQEIGRGIIVNQGNWQQQLETNTQNYVNEFVTSQAFAPYFSMTPAEYVDALNNNTAINGNGSLTPDERNDLVNRLSAGQLTHAQVLRAVAENAEFGRRQYNRAFVLMQYFGYLRRNPNDAPNTDFSGYNFWLNKLNQFGGNYITSEMVKGFITSGEYRQRFGNN